MRILFFLIFVPVQILWLPLSILGAAITGYRQLVISGRLGVSQTAIEILHGRYTMDIFGMRDDPASRELAWGLPNASPGGLWLTLTPLWIAYKLTGTLALYPRRVPPGEESLMDMVPTRTSYFDDILRDVLPQMQQFIALGAGFDTRTVGPLMTEGLRPYEVDQQSTQALKRKTYTARGVDTTGVEFITVDFSKDDLFNTLRQVESYDQNVPTTYLWEGVTLYLTEAAVRRNLHELKVNSAEGSRVLLDIYSSTSSLMEMAQKGAMKKSLDMTDEGLLFGLDFSADYENRLREFIESVGLTLGRTEFIGYNAEKGPYMVVAELIL